LGKGDAGTDGKRTINLFGVHGYGIGLSAAIFFATAVIYPGWLIAAGKKALRFLPSGTHTLRKCSFLHTIKVFILFVTAQEELQPYPSKQLPRCGYPDPGNSWST
jgi:hypothetical protein